MMKIEKTSSAAADTGAARKRIEIRTTNHRRPRDLGTKPGTMHIEYFLMNTSPEETKVSARSKTEPSNQVLTHAYKLIIRNTNSITD
jgi:hypothetical protein